MNTSSIVKRLYFNVSVVFDGYDSGPSTEDGMPTRRRSGRVAHDIDLSGNIPVCVKMEQILSNGAKKQTHHRVDSHIALRWLWSNSIMHLTIFIYLFTKTYLYRVVHNQIILIQFYSVALLC